MPCLSVLVFMPLAIQNPYWFFITISRNDAKVGSTSIKIRSKVTALRIDAIITVPKDLHAMFNDKERSMD
jgi:hypothetical protein